MTEAPRIRAVVVDDEPLGRRRIEDALRDQPDVEIVASVGDGLSAIAAIRQFRPSLVFLDVQMPRMTGLEVVRTLGSEMPLTIFVTAYDRHAVQAFELAATDYLIKPFDDERFEQALTKARKHLQFQNADRLRERLLAVLQGDEVPPEPPTIAAAPASEPHYLERIPVDSRGQTRIVPVAQVEAIVASGAYAELVVGDKRFLIRETMTALEEQLDPARFMRVHRSAIVALDRVDSVLRGAGGDYEVRLLSGARLPVSRARRSELEQRLGMKR